MNIFVILQTVLKLLLVLLMGLLPVHQTLAQEAAKEKQKMHIKVIRTLHGKTVVVDTTLIETSHEELAKALKAARLDTGRLRLLDGKVRMYTMVQADSTMRAKLFPSDSALRAGLRQMDIRVLMADSLRGKAFKRLEILQGEAGSMAFRGSPQIYIRSLKDSTGTFKLRDGQLLKSIDPTELERIVVQRLPGGFKMDSVLLAEGKSYLKIIADGEGQKVYRIDADGKQVEVDGQILEWSQARPGRAIFLVRKTVVEDITPSEKEQLKATGAAVEMKSREELKVEEISYFPNPSNGRFNLKFSLKNKGTTVVRIMDEKGREVFVDTVEKLSDTYERQIDLTPFGRGMYFLQVAQGGRYHTKKILVQ